MGVLLHIGAAIAFTIQVVSAQSAEIALSNERPIRAIDNLGFSPALATNGSYESYSHDSATDDAPGAVSTTRMLRGLYEFNDRSWQSTPYIGADFGMVDTREKPLGYPSGDWTAYRGGAATGLSQKPLGSSDNNWVGWKRHLSLAPPEITTKLGIPLNITQRGVMFGANYHF